MSDTASKLRDMEEAGERTAVDRYASKYQLMKKVRAGNRVKRFHTVDLLVGETVGHHSANVAMLCLIISETTPRPELIAAALTHDLMEQYTGDVPATAKWASAELAIALNDLEKKHELFRQDLTAEEWDILKQADMLDLCLKCAEELKMGNTLIEPILRRGLRYLQDHSPLPLTSYIVKELYHVAG